MMFNMHPEWLRGVEINVALGSNSWKSISRTKAWFILDTYTAYPRFIVNKHLNRYAILQRALYSAAKVNIFPQTTKDLRGKCD